MITCSKYHGGKEVDTVMPEQKGTYPTWAVRGPLLTGLKEEPASFPKRWEHVRGQKCPCSHTCVWGCGPCTRRGRPRWRGRTYSNLSSRPRAMGRSRSWLPVKWEVTQLFSAGEQVLWLFAHICNTGYESFCSLHSQLLCELWWAWGSIMETNFNF